MKYIYIILIIILFFGSASAETITTNIKFGDTHCDKVTGVCGAVVAISKWDYGCLRIGLQQKIMSSGKVPDVYWVDELRIVDNTAIIQEPGGPQQDPQQPIPDAGR